MACHLFVCLFNFELLFEGLNVFPEAWADMSMGLAFNIGNASSVYQVLNQHISNLIESFCSQYFFKTFHYQPI